MGTDKKWNDGFWTDDYYELIDWISTLMDYGIEFTVLAGKATNPYDGKYDWTFVVKTMATHEQHKKLIEKHNFDHPWEEA